MGARRIAAATGPLTLKNERRRVQGYRQALERAGIPVDEQLIWQGNLRPPDVMALCREKLAAAPRPEAIFSTNGPTALGVLQAFRSLSLATPRDIAFATFDELAVADIFSPSVTTIVQPAYEIGSRAANLLLDRIERVDGLDETVTLRLSANLKVGESSGWNGSGCRAPGLV